ncbi:YgaP-like transmembrane domain [Thermosulfurimonas marina]|nr:YgaP-like transmembrane domain [Thermosulfurimonas marina]
MKAIRAQRILMGVILLVGIFLLYKGKPCAKYIFWFVALMSILSGIVNFCPSEWFFRKIFREG